MQTASYFRDMFGLEGKTFTTLADLNGLIMEIATTPVVVGTQMIGVISIGHHLDDVMLAEFRRLTGCEIAFYSGKRVSVASWQEAGKRLSFFGMVNDHAFPFSLSDEPVVDPIRKLLVNKEHYLGLMGMSAIPEQSEPVRYGLFSSYENQYRELKQTQQLLLQLGVLGIWFGGLMAWVLTGAAAF